jgi:hypothetical protein
MTSRRSFLLGLGASLIAAPAIVRIANIMPVRALRPPDEDLVFAFFDPSFANWRRWSYHIQTGLWTELEFCDGRPPVPFPDDFVVVARAS